MSRSVLFRFALGVVLCVVLSPCLQAQSSAEESAHEFFEKEVRPILVARCFECHSGGDKEPRGGLRLDSRDSILKGGDTGPAVALENPASSLLISTINYGDLYQMPPKSKLPANEIAVLTKWVEGGIPWSPKVKAAEGTVKPFDLESRKHEHWCWQPIQEVAAPKVIDADWPRSDVDRFLLAAMEARGIHPTVPAEKAVLLRRVYFDLIGLPPSPEEVEAYLKDDRPDSLEFVVDRLLGSVHFGERWGRHWLDLVRYAETRGHEFEPIIPNAWQYRDYVTRAISADVPYDRFLMEHIAGDLLEPRWRIGANDSPAPSLPINEAPVGTAFWLLGEEVHSPVDIRKDETDRIDNRLDVMSKAFLGLTVACARCHDHKFDAISQKDYYALAGFVLSSNYRQLRVDTAEQHRHLAEQLEQHRSRTRRDIANAIVKNASPVLEKLDRYWSIAMGIINDDASFAANPDLSAETTNVLQKIAQDNGLDPTILARWTVELSKAKTDTQHPLHSLLQGVDANRQSESSPVNSTGQIPGLIVDFGDPSSEFVARDGVSFGQRPVKRGELVIEGPADSPRLGIATIGGWERDLFWKKITLSPGTEVDAGTLGSWQQYGRMVRTPEFTLKERNLWYLVKGSVHAYACVNSHLIVIGPLHGSVLRDFKQSDDQWHWVSQSMELHQGHRMHIEFSPMDDAGCAIAMVVQSDGPPNWPNTDWPLMMTSNASGLNERIAAYHDTFRDAASLIATGVVKNGDDTPNVSSRLNVLPRLSDWMIKHHPLFSTFEIQRPDADYYEFETGLERQVRWDSSLAPAVMDGNGVDEYLLVRGNSSTPKDLVPRRFLQAFASSDNASPATGISSQFSGSGRLELARQMLESPLAARVMVNRIWHHLFGRGIVPTVDNFGVLGLPPSHPELLDHLAATFIKNGWSTKSMIRSLVLSRAYQMSSHPTSDDAVDPNNELWHRMPLKRLEGEAIRDSILAVSGQLNRTPFGPSVAIHLTEFMQGRGRPGVSGPLDGNARRSLYISVRRNFLSPMMLAFDTPNPFSTVGRRTVSNVPAQALILMNDPFVIQQASHWAAAITSDSGLSTNEQRIDRMYRQAFGRAPTQAETADALAFLDAQNAAQPGQERDAWNHLCHVMFNLKEFVFVE